MVYHGVGMGITVYHDGTEIGSDSVSSPGTDVPGVGTLLIGRRVLGGAEGPKYTSAYLDELKMYNRQLPEEDISRLY